MLFWARAITIVSATHTTTTTRLFLLQISFGISVSHRTSILIKAKRPMSRIGKEIIWKKRAINMLVKNMQRSENKIFFLNMVYKFGKIGLQCSFVSFAVCRLYVDTKFIVGVNGGCNLFGCVWMVTLDKCFDLVKSYSSIYRLDKLREFWWLLADCFEYSRIC